MFRDQGCPEPTGFLRRWSDASSELIVWNVSTMASGTQGRANPDRVFIELVGVGLEVGPSKTQLTFVIHWNEMHMAMRHFKARNDGTHSSSAERIIESLANFVGDLRDFRPQKRVEIGPAIHLLNWDHQRVSWLHRADCEKGHYLVISPYEASGKVTANDHGEH